jgi:hypothetical protein
MRREFVRYGVVGMGMGNWNGGGVAEGSVGGGLRGRTPQ